MNRKYIIITPMKNEEKYIYKTINSIINQSITPLEWIIVNDGSTDISEEIIKSYSKKYVWIKLINLKTHGEVRKGGQKVVRAFNSGFRSISDNNYDFVVKLDADISFEKDYFESVFNEFSANPKLGVCGGIIYNAISDSLFKEEKSAAYHVRGAFKCYRKKCFQDIGGFKEIWNWDGVDIMETLYLGWESKQINKKVYHHRPTTSAYNKFSHTFKCGYEYYRIGNSLLLMIIRSIAYINKKPIIVGSLLLFFGYLYGIFTRADKVISDKKLISFINRFHLKRAIGK